MIKKLSEKFFIEASIACLVQLPADLLFFKKRQFGLGNIFPHRRNGNIIRIVIDWKRRRIFPAVRERIPGRILIRGFRAIDHFSHKRQRPDGLRPHAFGRKKILVSLGFPIAKLPKYFFQIFAL